MYFLSVQAEPKWMRFDPVLVTFRDCFVCDLISVSGALPPYGCNMRCPLPWASEFGLCNIVVRDEFHLSIPDAV